MKLNCTQTFAFVKCSVRIKYLEMSLMYEAVQRRAMFHVGYFVTWNKRKVTRSAPNVCHRCIVHTHLTSRLLLSPCQKMVRFISPLCVIFAKLVTLMINLKPDCLCAGWPRNKRQTFDFWQGQRIRPQIF